MASRSSLIGFSPFFQNVTSVASVRHCGGVSSTTTAPYTLTFAASWNCGLIMPYCTRVWDATWNQWKHLLETKMDVSATFVLSGKYRRCRGEWELVTWETALPSRLEVRLPADFEQHIDAAKRTYHRFGQFSAALDKIRLRIEYEAIEKRGIAENVVSTQRPRGL